MFDEIYGIIEEQERGLHYKIGDEVLKILNDIPLLISYNFLLVDIGNEYSFANEEINKITSEHKDHKGLSDFQIYLQKQRSFCSDKFNNIDHSELKVVNFSTKLKEAIKPVIDINKLDPSQVPTAIEIRLYQNEKKEGSKAPRIFGFITSGNVLNIVCYDPFHKIFNATE